MQWNLWTSQKCPDYQGVLHRKKCQYMRMRPWSRCDNMNGTPAGYSSNNIRCCYFNVIVLARVAVMATVTTKRKLNTDSSPVKKRRFCPHCSEFVGYSTHYRHRDKYFDCSGRKPWSIPHRKSDDDIVVCESKLHFCLLHGKQFSHKSIYHSIK